jgi:uncharacterized membrane protein
MSFRRRGTEHHQQQRQWADWLREHEDLIALTTLPIIYIEEETNWIYFLEHGSLFGLTCAPEYDLRQLTLRQKAALLRLIIVWDGVKQGISTHVGHNVLIFLLDDIEKREEE